MTVAETLPIADAAPLLSVVSPVYGAQEALEPLVSRLEAVLETLVPSYEIILVNDASPDDSWATILTLARRNPRVRGIDLARNFGQHYALTAGIDHARGEWVVTLDCDLQDRPEEIPRLLAKAQEGFDLVVAHSTFRSSRSLGQRLASRLFYRLQDALRGSGGSVMNASFVLMNRRVAASLRRLDERRRQLRDLIQYVGFRVASVDVQHDERPHGHSSYRFMSRLRLAIFGLVSSTTRLLWLGVLLGFGFAGLSFTMLCYIVAMKLAFVDYQAGWPSIMATIFFVGGTILLVLGILGIYLETIFYEVKRRPNYFIRDEVNLPHGPVIDAGGPPAEPAR